MDDEKEDPEDIELPEVEETDPRTKAEVEQAVKTRIAIDHTKQLLVGIRNEENGAKSMEAAAVSLIAGVCNAFIKEKIGSESAEQILLTIVLAYTELLLTEFIKKNGGGDFSVEYYLGPPPKRKERALDDFDESDPGPTPKGVKVH
jgi:hypothetical protein